MRNGKKKAIEMLENTRPEWRKMPQIERDEMPIDMIVSESEN